MSHPIVQAIIDNLPAYLTAPPEHNPFARKDRSGKFNCSDLNRDGRRVKFSPRHCVMQFLGLPVAKSFDSSASLHMAIGTGIDMAAECALRASDLDIETQISLYDDGLWLGGTPDFIDYSTGYPLVGDVKSTGTSTFRDFWGNPSWDLSRAYFWYQLQAYLLLTHTDKGMMVVVDRGGVDWSRPIESIFSVRYFQKCKNTCDAIIEDLRYMQRCVNEYRAANTDKERQQALPME